jgi:hypothetical protein
LNCDREIEEILSGSNLQIEVSRRKNKEEEFSLLIGAPVMVEGEQWAHRYYDRRDQTEKV